MKTWLITGASSGFGEALAEAVLAHGDRVAATFRKAEQAQAFCAKDEEKAFGITMDVTDRAAVEAGIKAAADHFGSIDVLVNNAGYALRAPVEQTTDEDAWAQLNANVMGILRTTRAVLPVMRAQGGGRIINISSTAGSIGFPTLGLYAASKAAVIGMTEALAQEVSSQGIRATSVEPGGFRTKFGGSSMMTPSTSVLEPYKALVETMDGLMAKFGTTAAGDPALAALKLIELAEMSDPPIRLALGDDALPMISGALDKRQAEYREHASLGQGTSSPI